MDLVMLGTGNAEALACYNSCCVLDNDGQYFLVDAGGGNGVLRQLRAAGIPWQEVRSIFLSHRHIDHSLGAIWLVRQILTGIKEGTYEGEATIYGHSEMIDAIRRCVPLFFSKKHEKRMRDRVHLRQIRDGETVRIAGLDVTFFDVHAPRTLQYGFRVALPGGGCLVSCGDEPARPEVDSYLRDAQFLMHEAYCTAEETELAERKGSKHSTAEEAAEHAERLGARNLILHHTQDNRLADRKQAYTEAAGRHFSGNVFVPDDLDRISLDSNK